MSAATNADVAFAGPPCTSFSRAGLQLASGSSSQVLFDTVALMVKCAHKMLVLENVPELRTVHDGRIYDKIVTMLSK